MWRNPNKSLYMTSNNISVTWGYLLSHEVIGKVINHGKITIPKYIRDLDGINDGDLVKLVYIETLRKNGVGNIANNGL